MENCQLSTVVNYQLSIKMETITYKGRDYALRFGWGAQYLYEAMQGVEADGHVRPFNPNSVWDLHRMLYAALTAYNRETFTDDFAAFVAELEARPADARRWTERLVGEIAAWGESLRTGQPPEGKKKADAPPAP